MIVNVVAISLVVTSVATANLFSAGGAKGHVNEESSESSIVEEGHKVVVVEYDEDGHENTKISILSPEEDTENDAKEGNRGEVIKRNVTREEAREALKQIGCYLVGTVNRDRVMNALNLVGLATAYGMSVWVTFISSNVLCRVMPRHQFGVVQSKIYPVYFRFLGYTIALALLGHVLSHRNHSHSYLQACNLVASLVATLLNALYLEPKASKVMFERMKVEKEQGRGREGDADVESSTVKKLNEKLNTLNSFSSFINILTLVSLTCHLLYVSQLVHP